MSLDSRYQQAKKVTLLGAFVNTLLGFLKVIGGVLFHSHGLIADGVHSFADLLMDMMVLLASKFGSQEADDSHPYGHQRIETAATLFLALLLILAGIGIIWDAIREILFHQSTMPKREALGIAVLSILANEALFHYTKHVGQNIQSQLIVANAWHHRSDAGSSVVVLLGILGSLAGLPTLDAIAAVLVGGLIIRMGINYGWGSVKELVDTAVDPNLLGKIKEILCKTPGVIKIHQLRTRQMGSDVFIDVHILVSPRITVSEGHYIAQNVHYSLVGQLKHVKDVTVHVDPEDDENYCPSMHLPTRGVLEQLFLNSWKADYPALQFWMLHYLNGQLQIDLICDSNEEAIEALKHRVSADLASEKSVSCVRILSDASTIDILPAASF